VPVLSGALVGFLSGLIAPIFQRRHDTSERKKEREFSLRSEVYLDAAEALAAPQLVVASLSRKDNIGSLVDAGGPGGGLSLVELCDRAVRRIFRLQGLSERGSGLKDRVVNCPSRVNRDPQKRRAELECVLGASTREDVRVCFGAK
jgi:hypothetical protein